MPKVCEFCSILDLDQCALIGGCAHRRANPTVYQLDEENHRLGYAMFVLQQQRHRLHQWLLPRIGEVYVVREWDDSENTVKVTSIDPSVGSVFFQYDDGLVHAVSLEYFLHGLGAKPRDLALTPGILLS